MLLSYVRSAVDGDRSWICHPTCAFNSICIMKAVEVAHNDRCTKNRNSLSRRYLKCNSSNLSCSLWSSFLLSNDVHYFSPYLSLSLFLRWPHLTSWNDGQRSVLVREEWAFSPLLLLLLLLPLLEGLFYWKVFIYEQSVVDDLCSVAEEEKTNRSEKNEEWCRE